MSLEEALNMIEDIKQNNLKTLENIKKDREKADRKMIDSYKQTAVNYVQNREFEKCFRQNDTYNKCRIPIPRECDTLNLEKATLELNETFKGTSVCFNNDYCNFFANYNYHKAHRSDTIHGYIHPDTGNVKGAI